MAIMQEKTIATTEKQTVSEQKGQVMVNVTLSSRGPGLLMNPMNDDLLEELAGVKSKSASDKDQPLDDRMQKKVIRENGTDGKIGIPVNYILGALKFAGRFVKNGKDKISTATSTTLFEFLTIEDEFFPFTNQEEPPITDMRRGVLNNAGKLVAVAIIRPKFKHWEINFDIGIDTTIISEEVVKKLFEAAGKKAGLGDFRPAKKGPFGMFSVTGWQRL